MPQIPDHYLEPEGVKRYMRGESNPKSDNAITTAEQRFFTASDRDDVVVLRDAVQELGTLVDLLVPPGRNKSLALTALEDVQMRANRGIFAPEELR